jgi:hypothetical protein
MKRKCNLSRSVFPALTHHEQFLPDHITDGPYSMTFHYQDEPYFQCFCWARNSNRLRAIQHRSAPSLIQRPIHVMAAKAAIHDFFVTPLGCGRIKEYAGWYKTLIQSRMQIFGSISRRPDQRSSGSPPRLRQKPAATAPDARDFAIAEILETTGTARAPERPPFLTTDH